MAASNPNNHDDPVRQVRPPAAYRWNRGAWWFRDDTLRSFEILLDEAFRVPGTQVRFGIDGIIGFVPGIGDALMGLLSMVIPIAAWMRGVPYITILRMTVNIGIGVLVGAIPIAGDIFDIFWKPNRRNLRLLHCHLREPRRHGWRDWVFLLGFLTALALIIASPALLLLWILLRLFHHLP